MTTAPRALPHHQHFHSPIYQKHFEGDLLQSSLRWPWKAENKEREITVLPWVVVGPAVTKIAPALYKRQRKRGGNHMALWRVVAPPGKRREKLTKHLSISSLLFCSKIRRAAKLPMSSKHSPYRSKSYRGRKRSKSSLQWGNWNTVFPKQTAPNLTSRQLQL